MSHFINFTPKRSKHLSKRTPDPSPFKGYYPSNVIVDMDIPNMSLHIIDYFKSLKEIESPRKVKGTIRMRVVTVLYNVITSKVRWPDIKDVRKVMSRVVEKFPALGSKNLKHPEDILTEAFMSKVNSWAKCDE